MMSIQPVLAVPLAACPPVRQDPKDSGGQAASGTWRCVLGILLALCLLAGGRADATADGRAGMPPSTRRAALADGDAPAVPVRNIVEMTLAGPLEERAAAFSAFAGFGRSALSMGEVLGALERARVTPNVAAVVLRLTGPPPALAQVQALRRKVAEVRAAGKTVFCLLSAAGHAQYLLATAADRIAIVPAGSLNLVGLVADVYFLKDLLDKIGVQMDLIQTGAFKGAAEPFTRTSMSPEWRRNFTSVLDDLYEGMVADVAKGRGLTPKKVKALIDNGPYSAREALRAGLVDWVVYPDQFDARVTAALKGPTQFVREPFGRRGAPAGAATNPLALMSAMLSMLSPPSAPAVTGRPRVAVVYVTGPIVSGESDVGLLGGEQAASGPICRALRRARRDDTVRAVVLRVNSPGGSVLASDLIWRDVGECARAKPVIASFGDLAASGGYYVSAPATAIVAEPATITGSIGVVGGKVVLGGLYAKLGIRKETIARGRRAMINSESVPFTDDERGHVTRLMRAVYDDFVGKVATGRRMKRERVEAVAQGRVWSGAGARRVGLVDELGGLEMALRVAKRKAGLPPDARVDVVSWPRQRGLLERLFGGEASGGILWPSLGPADANMQGTVRLVASYASLAQVFRAERVAVILARPVEVK